MNKPQLFIEPWDVRARLADLSKGLEESMFLRAGRDGFAKAAECTENHPVGARGYYLWSETTKSLRDELALLAWRAGDDHGLPLVVTAAGDLAIAVSSGDEYTGKTTVPEGFPQTKYPKGARTFKAVQNNNLYLPGMEPTETEATGRPTWFYLIRCDLQEQVFVSELSLPVAVNANGFINEWRERIILSTFSLGGGGKVRLSPDGGGAEPQTPVINVEIKKIA